MDVKMLSSIDEELDSSEVAALCFLCLDVLNRKRLETVKDGKELFQRLEEKGLLENNSFLSQLLRTIRRADLLNLLETDSRRPEESFDPQTDAAPVLSDYRVMLYEIYEDLTQENLEKMKFFLTSKLGKRQMENCKTALDVFAEMEKTGYLSNTDLDELHSVLNECDRQLALTVQEYRNGASFLQYQPGSPPLVSMDNQLNSRPPQQASVSVTETQPNLDERQSLFFDTQPNTESSLPRDPADYYSLIHNPHGVCMIINNEKFLGFGFKDRPGTQEDEKALRAVFSLLGFSVVTHRNLTADDMRREMAELGRRNFLEDDALVVCVLSHGEMGCVFGTDEETVLLRELTEPFTSGRAPTLVGKPKLFFIQACQGSDYQKGAVPRALKSTQGEGERRSSLEEDAGRIQVETVPWDADFLLGMATVPECKSFRNTSTGSIYVQELCRQLQRSAESLAEDDILTVLTRVNREVGRGEYLSYKQMPEPKYTLTKKLVLKAI